MWRLSKDTSITGRVFYGANNDVGILQCNAAKSYLYNFMELFSPISLSPDTNEALMKKLDFTTSDRNTTTLTVKRKKCNLKTSKVQSPDIK